MKVIRDVKIFTRVKILEPDIVYDLLAKYLKYGADWSTTVDWGRTYIQINLNVN